MRLHSCAWEALAPSLWRDWKLRGRWHLSFLADFQRSIGLQVFYASISTTRY